MGLSLITLLLCGVCVVAKVAYIEESYEVDPEAGEFNHMVIHKATGAIYIGAVNNLYKFDQDLMMVEKDVTGPEPDNPDCSPRIYSQECEKQQVPTNNYNKALLIDYTGKKLVYCISLFQGICEKRDLDEIKEVEKPIVYLPIVANNATATTYMFITRGHTDGEGNATANTIYVGVSSTNNGHSRHHVPAFASRKLSNFDLVYKDLSAKSQVTIDPIRSETFPVYYIYGFSSKGFSYMLSVQKQNPTTTSFITKLIRVCQDDLKFYSYAEVGLECHHDGILYNLLQAAYVSKAGNDLAVKLSIPPNEDVLYGVFSKGKPNSATAGQTSALCVYPLRNVIKMFTENIQACFEGTGNTGPAHLRSPIACVRTPTLEVSDDYCGKYDVNSPIDGTKPIKAAAAAAFNYTASAVTVAIVTNYTVALVGTSSGHLLKVALETQTKGTVYEDVTLFEGRKINADMYVSNEKEHLYVMTDRKLLKVRLYECAQYTSCGTCLGANNPYCGWCSLENKCSLQQECHNYNEKLHWLAYSGGKCTNITNVEPSKIQVEKEKTTWLDLNVTNLPSFKGSYQCVFSIGKTRITTTSTPIDQTNIIRCQTPKTNLLPPLGFGKDHIVMKLAVQIGGLDFVSTNFTFFDCKEHNSCTKCTLSEFPCTWCINNHKCTHDVEGECSSNVIVHGRNSVGKTQPIGPEMCPRIELQDSTTNNKILVPSGIQKKITVKAINLQDFQESEIKCFFSMGSQGNVNVPADINTTSHTVECAINDFSYPELTPMSNVPFTVSARNNPLDNPEKIQGNATVEPITIIMYKCLAMADTCGDCISTSEDYKCGWCDGGEGSCTIQSQCSRNTWLSSRDTCPNVKITQIMPLTGPKAGGTKLTIIGKNLGKQYSDITGGVTVAGVSCNTIEEEYEPPRRIVCRTGSHSFITSGIVNVEIGNLYSATAVQKFTYVQPVLYSVHPTKGPMSGGTKITITGRHLDAGTSAEVKVGAFTCIVVHRRNNSMVCKTGRAVGCGEVDGEANRNCTLLEEISAKMDDDHVGSSLRYEYISDPEIRTVQPLRGIVSGGILIQVTGTNLNSIQDASMVMEELEEGIRHRRRRRSTSIRYTSDCNVPKKNSKDMYCYSPQISNSTVSPDSVTGVKFKYGFQLDGVYIARADRFTIYPDPVLEEFDGNREKSYQSKTDNYLTINGKNLNLGFNSSDVKVRVGTDFCNVTSIDKHGNQLNCKPPKTQPNSAQGNKYPEVVVEVGRNFTKLIGYLKYEKTEILPLPVIIGLGTGGGLLVLIVIFFVVLWCIKTRENTSMKKKWQIQMDNLEVKVAKECKEAFAELQTDMTELTSDHFGQIAIPFWDYRTYCMRVLFPQEDDSYAVIREVEVDTARRDDVERGLALFSQLICNKTFLLMFVRTLEGNKKFSMRDRVNVASLISVALQTRMEYATEILKTLLAELISKSVEGKNHPKLLLRRTESIAEKMLSNWFTFLLYKFLRECAGEPLFMLYQAIKQQTSKGPVDSITSEARYSLSEDKLIRQQIDYKPITIYVQDMEQFGQQSHPVKVLDCDTISQVKEKILDAIYKNAPFSSRPVKANVDLVLLDKFKMDEAEAPLIRKSILSDVDASTKHDGEFKRFNSLAHYQVSDGAAMALVLKQTASICDLSTTSEKSMGNKGFDYRRFGTGKEDISGWYSRSPSLNRTASPQNVQIDVENTSNGVKYYHLVKQQQDVQTGQEQAEVKMVSEIYLTRLLATKGTLQQFVDDLFERIFSTVHRGTSLPLAIKYMFDFLDDQALQHNMQDLDIVHTWKSNSLPLRFWVNVIKNPNFVFDIYKSNIVDSCLSVVAQNFMDSCSMSEHKLGKDSPSSKLLYAKDIPTYRKWVDRYYQDIKMMPAISDQDMTAMMAEESRSHQDEFNSNAALFELYKYVNQYYDDLSAALDEDVFARQSKLCHKLEQVHVAMNGEAYC